MTGDLVKAYPFLSDAEAQRFGTGIVVSYKIFVYITIQTEAGTQFTE